MNRKLSGILVSIALLVLLVGGCAPAASPGSEGGTPSTPSAETITLVAQEVYTGDVLGTAGYMGDMYKEYVEKVTLGRVKIDLQPPGAVVPATDAFTAVSDGTIDIVFAGYAGYYTGVFPAGNVETGLPFAWLTAREAIEGYEVYGIGEQLHRMYAENNIHHQPVYFDTLYLLLSTVPINQPEDLKGLKVRAPGIYGDWVTSLGGSPITIPLTETYMAIKLGTMDASIMSPNFLETSSLKEVIPYVVLKPNLSTIVGNLLINQDSLDALPEDVRGVVEESGKYIAYYGGQIYKDLSYIQMAKDQYGLEIIEWDEDALMRATEAGVKTWDTVAAASPECAELVDIVKQQLRDEGRIS